MQPFDSRRERLTTDVVRLFFAADVHGSESVWRKWLSVPEFYKADIIIMAGDLTGKAVIPIVKEKDGSFWSKAFGKTMTAKTEEEVDKIKEEIMYGGGYPYICLPEEIEPMKKSQQIVDEVFKRVMVDNIERWMKMVAGKVPKETKVIVMPGNDDIFAIDSVIKKSDRVIYPLGKSIPLCFDYEMISLDYTNPTPWDSPRECSEDELQEKLDSLTRLANVDWSKVICNFHCPPYSTNLDLAPRLDRNLRPILKLGSPEMISVGSKSILEFLKKYQPFLSLHGHIHESAGTQQIGRTFAVNPGSEYGEGILRGMILEIAGDGLKKWWAVSG